MAAGNPDLAQMAAFYRQLGVGPDLAGPSSQGLPPTPASPNLNEQTVAQNMAATQQGMEEEKGFFNRIGDQERTRQALLAQQAQQAQAAVPHFGAMMRPVTGQGIGHDILNAIRDVGVGALAAGSATVPGRAIEGARYAPQRQALASTAQALRSTEGAETQATAGLGHTAGQLARPWSAAAEAGRTEMDWGKFQKQNAEQIREFDLRQQQQLKIAEAKLANITDVTQMKNEAMIEAQKIRANVMMAAAGMHLQGENARTYELGELGKIAATTKNPILTGAIQLLAGESYGQATFAPIEGGGQNPYMQPPAQPTTPQGSRGRSAAPARPAVKIGQRVPLKNGKSVTVTAVHPDGSFDAR